MTTAPTNALFLGTSDDKEYLPHLKGMFNGLNTFVVLEPVSLLSQLEIYCTRRSITAVVSTNTAILRALLAKQGNHKINPSLKDYQGSLFVHQGISIVFISPLRQLFTVSYGRFIASRFISKVVARDSWAEATRFSWTLATPSNIESLYDQFRLAFAIAVDIETFKTNLTIRCVGYTGVFINSSGAISTLSIVLPGDSSFNLAWMRKFNDLPAQKITQKGKYDNSYFLRYNAPIRNWLWDTANLFHCQYSELPKDLAFLNAFFLREVVYWKDLAETNDLQEYYKYNAIDTWATANVWIQQLLTMPDWARHNYTLEWPLVFPCLLSEMTGLERDHERHISARERVDQQIEAELSSLRRCLGVPGFNPNSPVQVKTLLKVLGCKDIESTEEKELKKAMLRHPLNALLLGKVLNIRGWRKLASTYLRLDSDADKNGEGGAKEFHGQILYKLDPDGTDTGRLASREHHFWCGLQIQNIPRGEPGEPNYTKSTIRAPSIPGQRWYLGECDLEQAESRDTGYISGDGALIHAVECGRDFHAHNASAFFGVPYDKIFSDEIKKTLDKKLRDLSKRTNHGANYNMGILVLIDTMGIDKVWEARRLLNLPYTTLEEVAEHLLTVFHLTYSGLRGPIKIRNENVRLFLRLPKCENKLFAPGTYYAAIAQEIAVSKRIVSRAFHLTVGATQSATKLGLSIEDLARQEIERGDWTRYCFGKPAENKLDLNAYIAHPSQSLNARTLNEAYLRVFYEVALPNPSTFRLHAQIHDSILFSYHEDAAHLAEKVKECMEIPVTVRDVHGIVRTFTVPAALKLGRYSTGPDGVRRFDRAVYWDETE